MSAATTPEGRNLAMTQPGARERYELALEKLKQAARRRRAAERRGDRDVAAYQADADEARAAYETVRKELG